MSNKANEDVLNSLHFMTAQTIAKIMEDARKSGDNELMLKCIKEARGFLKDNNVTADIDTNNGLREIEETVIMAELPFSVDDDMED